MADILEFIKARLDEDEAIARAATQGSPEGPWMESVELSGALRPTVTALGYPENPVIAWMEEYADQEHVCRHDPARVMREVAAIRKILALHEAWPVLVETEPTMEVESDPKSVDRLVYRMQQKLAWTTTQEYRKRFGDEPPTAPILSALAAIWDDHSDYQKEWR